ncbi:GTP cyclohydrolase I FolE [Nocardiopsis alba]|uniref:GTP cyclohydrolase 1 n=2 Tax=Nocardiopsis alba TaxID=53437 RepID=A0A7K2IZR1_9ACTN|nr:GTP cyclohydrolase I FolE [Nocardiopsis alba]
MTHPLHPHTMPRHPIAAKGGVESAPALTSAHTPRVVAPTRALDLVAATRAATDLLTALGVNIQSEGTERTPERMARALADLTTPPSFTMTTFPAQGYQEMVVVDQIPFTSVCEHHLLAFHGTVRVAYIPGERMVGLSKIPRLVEFFARRPQVQERMTREICDLLAQHLEPRGAGVLVRAEHTCMSTRGVRALGTTTLTRAFHGRLAGDARAREEFLSGAAGAGS